MFEERMISPTDHPLEDVVWERRNIEIRDENRPYFIAHWQGDPCSESPVAGAQAEHRERQQQNRPVGSADSPVLRHQQHEQRDGDHHRHLVADRLRADAHRTDDGCEPQDGKDVEHV